TRDGMIHHHRGIRDLAQHRVVVGVDPVILRYFGSDAPRQLVGNLDVETALAWRCNKPGSLHKIGEAFEVVVELLKGMPSAAVPGHGLLRERSALRGRTPLRTAVSKTHRAIGELDSHTIAQAPRPKTPRRGALLPARDLFQLIGALQPGALGGFVRVSGLA